MAMEAVVHASVSKAFPAFSAFWVRRRIEKVKYSLSLVPSSRVVCVEQSLRTLDDAPQNTSRAPLEAAFFCSDSYNVFSRLSTRLCLIPNLRLHLRLLMPMPTTCQYPRSRNGGARTVWKMRTRRSAGGEELARVPVHGQK